MAYIIDDEMFPATVQHRLFSVTAECKEQYEFQSDNPDEFVYTIPEANTIVSLQSVIDLFLNAVDEDLENAEDQYINSINSEEGSVATSDSPDRATSPGYTGSYYFAGREININTLIGRNVLRHNEHKENVYESFLNVITTEDKTVENEGNKLHLKENVKCKLNEKDKLAYTYALTCVVHFALFPLTADLNDAIASFEARRDRLMAAFNIEPEQHNEIFKRFQNQSPKGFTLDLYSDLINHNSCLLFEENYNGLNFYNQKCFKSVVSYLEWKEQELIKLRDFIEKVNPDILNNLAEVSRQLYDLHEAFRDLSQKMIRFDIDERLKKDHQLRNLTQGNNFAENGENIISDMSQALLKEFCLRYGIKETFYRLSTLEVLVDFVFTDWYLKSFLDTFAETMAHCIENEPYLVYKERETVQRILNLLLCKIQYAFEKKVIKLYMDKNLSSDGIRLLLDLFEQVNIYRNRIVGRHINIHSKLKIYLKKAFKNSYKEHQVKLEAKRQTTDTEVLTQMVAYVKHCFFQFNVLCQSIRFFPDGNDDIIRISAETLYNELMNHVQTYCESMVFKTTTFESLALLVNLADSLNVLDLNWSIYISDAQSWRTHFVQVLNFVIEEMVSKLNTNTLKFINRDIYHHIQFEDCFPDEIGTTSSSPATVIFNQSENRSDVVSSGGALVSRERVIAHNAAPVEPQSVQKREDANNQPDPFQRKCLTEDRRPSFGNGSMFEGKSRNNEASFPNDINDDTIQDFKGTHHSPGSSLIDVLIASSCLDRLVNKLYLLLLPTQNPSDEVSTSRMSSEGNRESIHLNILPLFKSYAFNLLSLDICGLETIEYTLPKKSVNTLKEIHKGKSADLPKCRHVIKALNGNNNKEKNQDDPITCLFYTELLEKSSYCWELITKKMCYRINNVYNLLHVLTDLQTHAVDNLYKDLYKYEKVMLPQAHQESDAIQQPKLNRLDLTFSYNDCRSYVYDIFRMQIELLAGRVFYFFEKLFEDNCCRDWNERSCLKYLSEQIEFFQRTLYVDCIDTVEMIIWKLLIQVYRIKLNDLQHHRDNPGKKAEGLSEMFQEIEDILTGKVVMLLDQFDKEGQAIKFRLKLYMMADDLQKLTKYYCFTSFDAANCYRDELNSFQIHGSNAEINGPEAMHLLRNALPSVFSGQLFVEILNNNKNWFVVLYHWLVVSQSYYPMPEDVGKRLIRKKYMKRCKENTERSMVRSKSPNHPENSYDPVKEKSETEGHVSWSYPGTGSSTFSSTRSDESPIPENEDFIGSGDRYFTFVDSDDVNSIIFVGQMFSAIRHDGFALNTLIKRDIEAIMRYHRYTPFFNKYAVLVPSNCLNLLKCKCEADIPVEVDYQ